MPAPSRVFVVLVRKSLEYPAELTEKEPFWGRALRSLRPMLLLVGLCVSTVAGAQSGSAAPSAQRKTSTPYAGDLTIFDSPGRDERLQINRVMDMLGIAPGETVADIGAGSGWFTVRAARRVTGSGTVYAVDINAEAIHYIDQRAKKEQLQNIKTILSGPTIHSSRPGASTRCCCSRRTTKSRIRLCC